MPLTQQEHELHVLAQERIRRGVLPGVSGYVWTGCGANNSCALCGAWIERGQIEYQVTDTDGHSFNFHLRCHAIWLSELPPSDAVA
jgi:hypothetical protein